MAQNGKGLTLKEIERETDKLAADLAFCARRPVDIQLVGGKHIAFTYNTDEKKQAVPIVMNPNALSDVRNKERAIRIWRGIGFHELAHHLWPAGEQYVEAQKGGFRHLFNLVDDEQNERRGRAFDASWGACFQSVCAHIFSSKKRRGDISTGIVDGGKEEKKPRGISASQVYADRWNEFAFHFRRHIPNPSSAIVAEALELVPKRFMDLTKQELFELTHQIHEVLARGIELPKEDLESALPPDEDDQAHEEKKQPEDKKEDEPKAPDEDAPVADGTWNIKRLLSSKWLYIPFGIFIAIWGVVLMQGSVDMWVQTAIYGVVGIVALVIFLFMRRAYIKALIEKMKAAATAAAGSSTPSAPSSDSTKKKIKTAAAATSAVLILILCGVLVKVALGFFPVPWVILVTGLCALIACMVGMLKLEKQARKGGEPLSKWVLIPMGLTSLASAGAVVFGLLQLGVGKFWLFPLGFVLGLGWLLLVALMLNAGKNQRSRWSNDSFWERVRQATEPYYRKPLDWVLDILGAVWRRVWKRVCRIARFIADVSVRFWFFCVRIFRRIVWKVQPLFKRLWRNPVFRLAIVAMPIAALMVILYSIGRTAAGINWWLLALFIFLLLLLLFLAWFFRKRLKDFLVNELFMPMPQIMTAGARPPLDMKTDWFIQIDNVQQVEPDQAVLDELLPQAYALAQQLRPYLAKCGRAVIDREDEPDGFDLTDEAELALVGESQIFVNDDVTTKASVHLEVALDCSSSMASATKSLKPGEKFLLGKLFSLVLEQAVINLPGVSAHFWGFTDNTIYDCGVPGERRSSGLVCRGGDNDAAMLYKMGQSAAESGKDVKILLMLSDGQPSECSWKSLHNLVLQFEQAGMIPWNFALDEIDTPAFEHFFTDLVGQTMEEAVRTMGETLASLAENGI